MIAEQTMQPAAVLARKDFAEIIAEAIGPEPKIVMQEGALVCEFARPITNREYRRAVLAHFRQSQRPDDDRIWRGATALLGTTGKMKCWGFSLPAGPPSLLGTCLGSIPGFPMLTEKQRAVRLSDAAKSRGPIKVRTFVCGGCYALKARYTEPGMIFTTETRRQIVRALLRSGGPEKMAGVFEQALLACQAKSMRAYAALKKGGTYRELSYSVSDPAFFRLHDAGDFWSPEYAEGWFEVARRFQKGRRHKGFDLPAVTFWTPTRLWAIAKFGPGSCPSSIDFSCAPKNLTARPSALHFSESAPLIHGFPKGSASGPREKSKELGTWLCPAYLPPKEGGGAEPHPKFGESRWVQGTCTRSEGPGARSGNKAHRRVPDGHGCRVCWLDPNRSVVYMEH